MGRPDVRQATTCGIDLDQVRLWTLRQPLRSET